MNLMLILQAPSALATTPATTAIGVAYGPSSSLTGIYSASERYTDIPVSLVAPITYRYDTTGPDNRTGTLDVAAQIWNAPLTTYNTTGTFGWFIKKLLTVTKFLGLK